MKDTEQINPAYISSESMRQAKRVLDRWSRLDQDMNRTQWYVIEFSSYLEASNDWLLKRVKTLESELDEVREEIDRQSNCTCTQTPAPKPGVLVINAAGIELTGDPRVRLVESVSPVSNVVIDADTIVLSPERVAATMAEYLGRMETTRNTGMRAAISFLDGLSNGARAYKLKGD